MSDEKRVKTKSAFISLIRDIIDLYNDEFGEVLSLVNDISINKLKVQETNENNNKSKLISDEDGVDNWFITEFDKRGICDSIRDEGCNCDDRFCYKYINWRDQKNLTNR